jgi:REP element-mobilizing transposase RayT
MRFFDATKWQSERRIPMPRGPRLDAEGALHHVMARGIEGCTIFLSDRDRDNFIERLSTVILEGKASLYAWVLQPNHLHLVIETGRDRISRMMRRLLTGYSVYFNRRYRRVGHLFQNRFKSILVEGDAYFLELVRYVHLNPLRSRIVKDINELDTYPWAGHTVLLGGMNYTWQNTERILGMFGGTVEKARLKYREFTIEGIKEGRRPDLVGGGLVRSIGGTKNISELKRGRERWAFDERILGSSEFVSEVLEQNAKEIDEARCHRGEREADFLELVSSVGKCLGLSTAELTSGARKQEIVEGRYVVSHIAIRRYGLTPTQVGNALNVSIQSVLRGLERGGRILAEKNLDIGELLKLRK